MHLLENTIQPYAWGSRTALSELMGRPSPSATPEAELWMGAHPLAPSKVAGEGTLMELIARSPETVLGRDAAAKFGGKLPFLMKVLAAQDPLSLQAHPNLKQAQEGFERENLRGIPLSAPHRNYKDSNHKPELLCALTPFDALCGFRPALKTLELFRSLDVSAMESLVTTLEATPDERGLRVTFEGLMRLPSEARSDVTKSCLERCRALSNARHPFAAQLRWAVRLGEQYPGDIGAVSSLLLNLVHLEPGDAIFLHAGNLHAYLSGVAVEVMASSDNVLRGGLTVKHVDISELMNVLEFKDEPVKPLKALPSGPFEETYLTPVPEFRLSRITLETGQKVTPARRGPEIVLCTKGAFTLQRGGETLTLVQGASAFIGADEAAYVVEGVGTLFRTTL
ncbi:MAG: mannose-6-phosphate isomerase, class I [Myxococcaceae bacterium]